MPSDILKRYLLQRMCTRETGDVNSLSKTPDLLSSKSEEDEAVRVNKRNVIAHPPTLLVAQGFFTSLPTSC